MLQSGGWSGPFFFTCTHHLGTPRTHPGGAPPPPAIGNAIGTPSPREVEVTQIPKEKLDVRTQGPGSGGVSTARCAGHLLPHSTPARPRPDRGPCVPAGGGPKGDFLSQLEAELPKFGGQTRGRGRCPRNLHVVCPAPGPPPRPSATGTPHWGHCVRNMVRAAKPKEKKLAKLDVRTQGEPSHTNPAHLLGLHTTCKTAWVGGSSRSGHLPPRG